MHHGFQQSKGPPARGERCLKIIYWSAELRVSHCVLLNRALLTWFIFKEPISGASWKMFEKTLSDLVKGLRSNKRREAEFVSKCIAEIKDELSSKDKSHQVKVRVLFSRSLSLFLSLFLSRFLSLSLSFALLLSGKVKRHQCMVRVHFSISLKIGLVSKRILFTLAVVCAMGWLPFVGSLKL